jgi:hypothetical protein
MQSVDEIVIPPLMHFIWAGGTKKLPEDKGMRNIAKWQLVNSKFQPVLWVDPKNFW